MSRAWLVIAALTAALGAGTVRPGLTQPVADQKEHAVESRIVNVNGELIQLSDGTVVRVPHGLALQSDLREGRKVKVRYHIKEGQPFAKSIEFLDEPSPEVRG
jgi:hypothetical protein